MIPDEAVEAAAKAIYESESHYNKWDWAVSELDREDYLKHARAALEAAAHILLSHERQQTADAHRDAIVNRDTADRLERELETAKADAWDEGRESVDFDSCGINPYRSQA